VRAFLLIVGCLLVAALSALFAGPVLIDWNAYRSTFEKQVTALLGREVRVGGNASLRLLPAPYLHFNNVRIADQTGRFDNPLIRVEGFTLWLSVPPLLRGAIEAREIELDRPDIRLSVDDTGRANWQGLAPGHVQLPFMPTEVSLASVKIRSGRLSIGRGGIAPLIAVGAIDGELIAAKLEGPYRFKGSISFNGAKRDVRISTAALAAEHRLKVKAVVRVPETANAYTFDGDLLALDALPRLSGALEAQFGLDAASFAEAAEGQSEETLAATSMRLTGRLEADLERGALTDLSITFDSDGRPQIVSGEIGIEWRQRPAIAARLAARWLDLDRISGEPATQGPWPALRGYVGRFLATFAANAETRVVVRIDQANLGGALLGNIALDARRTSAGIEIAALTAQLPGATTVDVTGLLTETEGSHRFSGPVRLSGASLGKLLKWAMPDLALDGPAGSGFYMIGADADLASDRLALDNLMLEIDRSRVAGSIRFAGGERNVLTLALDGDRLDLSEVVTEAPDLPALLAGWAPDAPAAGAATSEKSLLAVAARLVATADAEIALRIGDLRTGAGRIENVTLRMRQSEGRIDLDELSFKTGSELQLEATGSMSAAAAEGEGVVRLRVEAPSQAAVAALDRLVALPDVVRTPVLRYAVQAPLRLAGTIRRNRGGGKTEIALDGSAAGQRITMSLRADRGITELASGQTALTLSMASKDGARLLARLAGRSEWERPAELAVLEPPVPGELTIRASGVPDAGMTTVAKLTTGGFSASFEGDLSAEGDTRKVEGRIDVAAESAATLLDAVGVAASPELAQSLDLKARIATTGSDVVIDGIEGRFGGAPVGGKVTVATGGPIPELNIDLSAERVRLAGLLAPLLAAEGPEVGTSVAETAVIDGPVPAGGEDWIDAGEETVWTDRPIDLALLEGWKGRLKLRAGQLEVLAGLSLEDSSLNAIIDPGGVVLETLEGNALGGAVKLHGSLRRETAGASLALDASVTGAELEELFVDQAGRSKAKGTARARLSLRSTGLTPRGLIAVLEGEGELNIDGGQIAGLSPVTVDQAARLLLTAGDKVTPEAIGQSIGASRQAADFPIGSFATKLSVVDGTLRAEAVEIAAEQSSVRLEGKLDLDSFRIESDWTIAPKPVDALNPPLPPVSIVYAGPLAEIRTLAAEADVAALERELVARQLIGGEEQLDGLWPDAPPGKGTSLVPDADRTAPIPAEEALANVPEPVATETLPITTEGGGTFERTVPKPKPAAKVKRNVKRTTVIIRDHEGAGLR
jgi:uncharacterized protein involved in outer membrane biogenesis